MIFKKSPIIILFILLYSFFPDIPLNGLHGTAIASNRLPYVSSKMEHPDYWIKKIRSPDRLLLTPGEIQRMNEKNLKRDDLYLCSVKDLKEDWSREEILALLKEEWDVFGKPEGVRFGRYGLPHDDLFWNELKTNLNENTLKEKNRLLFGLIIRRTDIRVLPTGEPCSITQDDQEFDRFQHSSIAPGSLISVYHFSKDRQWVYAQTGFIRGWIRVVDVAIAMDKNDALNYDKEEDRLVMTGNFVTLFSDLSFQQPTLVAQMGTSLPLFKTSDDSKNLLPYYLIKIPFRESDGSLSFRKAYLPRTADVHRGFLPYTQRNLARQAFKMLHQPYGWGEMFGARDCSRFIMDLFNTFGILLPRNSKLQAMIGIPLGEIEGKTLKEKKKELDRAIPLATLLRLPGHIMLYLGKDDGKYYVIHNIWGIEKSEWFGSKLKKIGRVVVSDLSLGKSELNKTLLHRITNIQLIGSEKPNSP